jgi:hypothetical protein
VPFSTKTHVSHSLDTASEWNISAEAPLGDDPKMLPPSSSSSHGIPPREAKGWQRHVRACEPILTRVGCARRVVAIRARRGDRAACCLVRRSDSAPVFPKFY